jgi:hypothetical protein
LRGLEVERIERSQGCYGNESEPEFLHDAPYSDQAMCFLPFPIGTGVGIWTDLGVR